ncbi:hypothetical protein H6F96_21280 [Microcoleus sp. FACHB-53]|nr:hypothetical protein [Microcoleus sp. FACHB-53]
MLKSTPLLQNTSATSLVKIWAQRYVPDLSIFSSNQGQFNISEVMQAASLEGRTQTVAKLQRLLQTSCELASIKTNILFSYIPNVVNLSEAGNIARSAVRVYEKVLDIYQQQSSLIAAQDAQPQTGEALPQWVRQAIQLPDIQQLALELEPELLQLQEQHLLTQDGRSRGFLSTHFHLSTKQILNRLTLPEQALLSPYFKFIEEQVCIPWQRVCAAAAQHPPDSPTLALVEQLLPQTEEIALTVYHRAVELYPHYRSYRGSLSESGVAASTLRDLNMFQGYLWLCVLEKSLDAVEQELLPLCQMVFPCVEVKGECVESILELLFETILTRVDSEHKFSVKSYSLAIQQSFTNFDAKVK